MAINIPENKAVNSGSKKLPCVILVDTSGSMSNDQNALIEGIKELKTYLEDDEMANDCVEIGIVTFDDKARVVEPFGPVEQMRIPEIHCNGMTAMHQAVEVGLEMIEKRRKEYKQLGISCYRPWMYMLTDGGANDSDNGSFDKLRQRQVEKKLTFFPVAIGNEYVDKNLLGSFRKDGVVFSVNRESLVGAFAWLSDSLSSVSSTGAGAVSLPAAEEHDMRTEHIQVDVD